MLGLVIDDTKSFMNHLFKEETFDTFDMVSLALKTMVYYEIDGQINKDYFDTDEQDSVADMTYQAWSTYKQTVTTMIKGKRPPMYIKLVLSLSSIQTLRTLDKIPGGDQTIQGFFINIVYEHPTLKIMTGTNYKTFTMDKTGEKYFDDTIRKYLSKHHIDFSEAL